MPTYQPGIPTGTVPLNQDYLNLQGNFTQLNTVYNGDHSALTGTLPPGGTAGYHVNIHQVPFSTTSTNPPNNQPVSAPTNTPGYGQIFQAQINDGIVSDEALYFLSGGNRLTQLTRNFQPSINANGSTFLPGGLIFQWGIKNSSIVGTITFSTESPGKNIAFPNNCFSVWTQLFQTGVLTNKVDSVTVEIANPTNFTYAVSVNGTYQGFFWFAIGN